MTREHLADIERMHQDEQFMAFLGGVRNRAATAEYVERNVVHWEKFGFGICVLRDASSGEIAGRGGLRRLTTEEDEEVEIGYALFPDYWNRGLATEVAIACGEVARERRLSSVVAVTVPANAAARRVMSKAGFTYERDVVLGGIPLVLYRRVLRAEDASLASSDRSLP